MRHHVQPNIGNWYKNIEDNSLFEVVASDFKDDYVEVQYFNGEIDEFDYDTWYNLELKNMPEPEDWSGPFELTKEDIDYLESSHPDDWSDPISDLDLDKMSNTS